MIKPLSKKSGLILLALAFFLGAFFLWPLPDALLNPVSHEPLRILDRNEKILYEVRALDFGTLKKIPLAEVPPLFVQTLLATEDRDFYSHLGISVRGIVRSALTNFQAGKVVAGGSTLTQQLVRNRLQPMTRDFGYKLAEMYFALRLEMRMSKNEILESYLNTAYFGHQAYGLAGAAEIYFGKTVATLSLAENALLVGLVQSPTALDPFVNLGKAEARAKIILTSLHTLGKISDEEYATALAEKIVLAPDHVKIRAPHFVMWLLQNLIPTEGDNRDCRLQTPIGEINSNSRLPECLPNQKEISTTLDLELQNEIELIVKRALAKLQDKNVTNASVVVLNARTGELLAMLGSADYFDDAIAGKVNVALAPRQPGSALKPFVYALALAQGDTAATTVADIETQFFTATGNPYTPRNYDYADHGLVRYREALANSYNIAAVKVLKKVGVSRLLNFLKQSGITTLTQSSEHYGLALGLGDGEVRLLELAQAYGIFARGGETLPLQVLLDPNNSGLLTSPYISFSSLHLLPRQILDPKIAWLITDILADNNARLPEFGDDSPLNFDFPVATKTGTTRNSRDNWTFGFTPERIVGVWVGNADNTPMRGTSGVTGAGPIFHAVMETALRDQPKTWFTKPDGIVEKEICRLSGKLPTPFCPHTIREFFISETEPHEPNNIFQALKIDTRNNLRAGENCPAQFVTEKVFANFPLELKKWAQENSYALAPENYSPLCPATTTKNLPTATPEILITRPNAGDSFQLDKLIPLTEQKVFFEASAGSNIATLEWHVDGVKVGVGIVPDFRLGWQPTLGAHTLTAHTESTEAKLKFEVVN